MKKEDIMPIVTKVLLTNNIDQQSAIGIISEYIFEKKNFHPTIEQLNGCSTIFGMDNILMTAVQYYQIKFGAMLIYNKTNQLVKVAWQ